LLARHWTWVALEYRLANKFASTVEMRTCSRIRRCGCQRESLSQPSAAPTGLVFFQAQPGPGADRGYEGCDGGVSGTSHHRSSQACSALTENHRLCGSELAREGSGADYKYIAVSSHNRSAVRPPRELLIWLLILGAPLNHAGRNPMLIRRGNRQDAGLAALGQGWPFAATLRINVGLRACRA